MNRTDDGHHIVVDGRRWRATDPGIPEELRRQLVSELMAARRAVGNAEDDTATAEARTRVQDAKLALGERGDPWWAEPTTEGRDTRVAATIRTLLRHRDVEATICPSDAARVVGGDAWRDVMDHIRAIAGRLASENQVEIRQGGRVVDVGTVSGPVRIGRGQAFGVVTTT